MKFNQIVDYPFYDDDDFYHSVFHRREFFECRYTDKWWEGWTDMSQSFKHLPHQRLTYNLLGPHTPYMGEFLFHGCGSGKTECASQFVEANKLFMDEHQTRALILVPNEMIMSSMIYDFLGKEVMPDGSIRFKKKGTGDKYMDRELRDVLNSINSHSHTHECPDNCEQLQQTKIRRIVNYIKKEKLLQYYEIETHQRFAKIIDQMSPEDVEQMLSNRVVVVDEIHKIRNQTTLYKALLKMIQHGYNIKILFMSGTACVDRENEIRPIINLLRMNDGKMDFLSEKNIRMLFHKDQSERDKAELEFGKKMKGYVSFIRGMNPMTFPVRKEVGSRFFENINFNTIECVMEGVQLIRYVTAFFNEFNPNIEANVTNELWDKTRCASRCAFENTTDEEWLYENVENISCKFKKMWEMFRLSEGKGAILIYAFNVEKGINLVERFLCCNGIQPLTLENATDKTPKYINFSNIKSSELRQRALDICKSHENYRGEYIKFILGTGKIRTGITFRHLSQVHVVETDWNIPTTEQTIFRGARQFSHHHPFIKETCKEILTFRYRSVISEKKIEEMPKKMVSKYRKMMERFRPQLKKRGFLCSVMSGENSGENDTENTKHTRKKRKICEKLLSIDDFMYKACLRKDIPGNRVERLLKEFAIDNPLYIRANFFPSIEGSSFEGSRIANYDKLEFRSPIPSEEQMTPISRIKEPNFDELDGSTYNLKDWVILMNDTGNTIQYIQTNLFDAVIDLFNRRIAWRFNELIFSFQFVFPHLNASNKIVAYIIDWLVETQYKFCVKLKNRELEQGYIIYANDVYIWTPLYKIIQTSMCDLVDISKIEDCENILNNFEIRYFSIRPHLKYNYAFNDVFSEVLLDVNASDLYIPQFMSLSIFSVNSSLKIKLKTDLLCGVIDNTKDKPNEFNLKLRMGRKKLAASSKLLFELKYICDSLKLDTSHIRKKDDVCKVLRKKLISMNTILPWAPKTIPSLHRLYLVSIAWGINDALTIIRNIVNDIIDSKGRLFVNAVVNVISLKRKNIRKDFPEIDTILEDYFLQRCGKKDFVLRLLERMHGDRPTRVKTDVEWKSIARVYEQQFYQKYKKHIVRIHKLVAQNIQQRIK